MSYNLKRHLARVHKDIELNRTMRQVNPVSRQIRRRRASTQHREIRAERNAGRRRKTNKLTEAEMKTACVEMLAQDGVAYRFFEQSGFRRLTRGIQSRLNKAINRKSVVAWVDDAAATIRFRIAQLLKNRMFNIIVDAASRFGRSVLCITAQLIEAGQIKVCTLGLVEMTQRHTADNIVEEIKLVLSVYDLELKQIYSISSDNASNMINAANILSDYQKEELRLLHRNHNRNHHAETEMDDDDADFDYFNAGFGMFKIYN